MTRTPRHPLPVLAAVFCCALLASAILGFAPATCADEPYAPSRDYDLQDIRTHLWFDIDKREVRGEVTEQVAALRDDVTELRFDSVGLEIQSVAVDGKTAKFSTTPKDLLVSLDHPAARGQRLEVLIHYDGQPKKGLYFILPDKNYPRPAAGNLDAGRGRGHALLHSALRLPERPDDVGNAAHRPGNVDHHFQRAARWREG